MLDMLKMGLKLLLITAVAALLLGGANILTRDAIDEQERLASDQARRTVLQAERFEQQEVLPRRRPASPASSRSTPDTTVRSWPATPSRSGPRDTAARWR